MGRIWQEPKKEAVPTGLQHSGKLKADSDSLAQRRVEDMMKKSITTTNPDALYKTNGNGGVLSREEKVELARDARKEQRGKLSQWYGMKRVKMTPELEQEMQLLRYRSLVHKDGGAPKIPKSGKAPEFFETGYFVGVGKNRRRKLKSFADEWLAEDPNLAYRVDKMVTRDVKTRKRQARKEANKQRGSGAGKKKAKADSRSKRDVEADGGEGGDAETRELIRETRRYGNADGGNAPDASRGKPTTSAGFGRETRKQVQKRERRASR
jgi:hypothetical protein